MTPVELPIEDISTQIAAALAEDLGSGDITADLIPESVAASARVISRDSAVICGCAWFNAVFKQLDESIVITWEVQDSDAVGPKQTLCHLQGPARAILSGERIALNFLQTLSSTATQTRRYVNAVRGTGAKILDTRKTIPGFRTAQKYAVNCGGGKNHRMGLYDMFLIKENHIISTGSIAAAVKTARQRHPQIKIEVETETLDELQQALNASADIIMLDNFDLTTLRKAVALVQHRVKLEASGGVNLDSVRSIAETGVDYISVGALTKDIHAIDLSMRFEFESPDDALASTGDR
ncbi:MAG: carboxylating nicotinate-nucleotide diphosphorylase [Gammaproteobacteria bacterium]|nr:carboxylating nicotinate-nucleotide diphosphorylase [Gammaproteobacteria bacterium]